MQQIYAYPGATPALIKPMIRLFGRMLFLAILFGGPITLSAQFTSGNVVVLQAGDGSSTLANTGNPILLKEFTPAGAAGITVTVPSTGANPMVISGSATSEGLLSRSQDGSLLVFGGYAQALPNATSITGATALTINRAVGTVNAAGVFTRVATSSTFFSANNIRSAASDGANNYWAHGANDGTNYFGTASAAATVQNAKTNTRFTLVYNGNLYMSSGSTAGTPATTGIFQVGTGLPVTSGQTLTTVINTTVGTSPSPYQFFFNTAGTICYVADDRSIANGGGIQKWTLSGGVWSLAYTLTTGSGSTVGARGVIADFSGTDPIVYATTAEGTLNRLIKITDNGSGAVAATLATATTNTIFRGIAFAPFSSTCPTFTSAPANVTITNSSCASACTVSGGLITAPSGTPCPTGSTLQYQVNGGSWSSTVPTYAQTGPTQTIKTRCSCDADNTMNSAESTPVSTVPGTCTPPSAGITVAETSGTTNNDGIICAGASATLTGTGGTSYAWSNGTNTAANTVTPASTTTYTVTVTNANGCTATSTSTITVNPLPTPTITVAETS
ncbi:MAG: hypothetical protein WCK82_14065, partial [Bacteroidota bacterium]